MTKEELNEILELHAKWLRGKDDGVRANLCDADLYSANLCDADLRDANLRGADFRGADFRGADFRGANLYSANLCGANLYSADFRGANLYSANLCGANLYSANLCDADLYSANLCDADLRDADLYSANLCDADLRGADLRDANFRGADLRDANLRDANLRGADFRGADFYSAKNIPFIPMVCPEIGSYIAFKKANKHIVVLEIPEDAKRSSATSKKCRANKAKVLRIEELNGDISDLKEIESDYDSSFVYRVGEIVEVEDFDEDRWNECSTGIHHFINRQEAVKYSV